MIESVEHLFHDDLLTRALEHFDIDADGLVRHEGFCSLVYEGARSGRRVVLKISHSGRLSIESLRDELAFVGAISSLGARVCAPLTDGERILTLPDAEGGAFFCYLYAFVGVEGLDSMALSEDLLARVGEALGSFHAASREVDSGRFVGRDAFLGGSLVQYREILPPDETDTLDCFDAITEELRRLPTSGPDFGMIHGDAHDGNFLVGEEGAWLIDFDEIERGFFVSDVATLVESLCESSEQRTAEFVEWSFDAILRGYARHMDLTTLDWSSMGAWMKFSWISDHCLKHLLYAESGERDFERRRARRRALFRSGFEEDAFLHRYDYEGAAERALARHSRP